MGKAIEVKSLRKSFKSTEVLKGVDFEVNQGEIFALLGSNGAGKTTIVKILTTLLKSDGGTAVVNGFDVMAKPDCVRQSISLTWAVCRRGRNPDRTGKSDHDRQTAAPHQFASGCGRFTE
jgi:ABC-type Na+ transport system ATPase subunit NatA